MFSFLVAGIFAMPAFARDQKNPTPPASTNQAGLLDDSNIQEQPIGDLIGVDSSHPLFINIQGDAITGDDDGFAALHTSSADKRYLNTDNFHARRGRAPART